MDYQFIRVQSECLRKRIFHGGRLNHTKASVSLILPLQMVNMDLDFKNITEKKNERIRSCSSMNVICFY